MLDGRMPRLLVGCVRFVGLLLSFAGRVEGGVVFPGGSGLGALRQQEGTGDAALRRGLGVGAAVADGERGLVLGDRLVALGDGLGVIQAAEVDVAPGLGARVLAELERGLKA